MKKAAMVLVVGFLTVHCQPPPKRPEKNHYLRLENLIYSVALSSFKLAYQMDIKRKEHVLQQVKKQLEKEKESSSVALKALEERVAALIEKNNQAVSGNEDASEDDVTLQIHEADASESVPVEPLSLEEKLAQLESLVFKVGSEGLLFRVKVLQEKWTLLNSPPSLSSGELLEAPAAELTEDTAPKSSEAFDSESQVKDLFHFILGEGHFPGVHSQITELEKALSFISVTEDQDKTLTEKAEQFVKEQKDSVPEGASVEERLVRLERLIYGSEEWKGIMSWIEYLQTQAADLSESQTDSLPAAAEADNSGSEG